MKCPCGGDDFATCCGPRLDDSVPAPSAEALMRSRYTAFTRADVNHLRRTQRAPSRDASWEDTAAWANSVCWLGLEIIATEAGGPEDQQGAVEFAARFLEGGTLAVLRERSAFSRVDGRWQYDEGSPQTSSTPIERNALCPCGSGRKFKACHA